MKMALSGVRSLLVLLPLFLFAQVCAQSAATVSDSMITIPTYSFSDPNPVPVLTHNPKIYPYHTFDGYSHEAVNKQWKVVTLENDYLKVYILPEIGGKVWGAVEKATGREFIYRNEVIKFRNIAMRGPWTSGGIEFNFGIIGHHPSTATPVDYTTRKNSDGSVSCFVGNIDLPSQTQWRVEIRLPADRAYFETRVLFANGSEVPQAYYNWMTAAAVVKDDLRFYTPGNAYLEHGGTSHPWPQDSSSRRDLSLYRNNDFGGSKSYHVVGAYDDFFGGYYENEGYGFGHWAEYEEMPGQKLWLWALSRQGGIWEDLLTDDDGQYIEFQAGRMLDQYSLNSAANPITKGEFEPGRSDLWREFWFPIPDMGGLSEVSKGGMLHVQDSLHGTKLSVTSFGEISSSICVKSNQGDTILMKEIDWKPLQPQWFYLDQKSSDISIEIPRLELLHNKSKGKEIARPFAMDSRWQAELKNSLDYQSHMAEQQSRDRNFVQAKEMHSAVLSQDPVHMVSRLGLAHLDYRNAEFDSAWKHVEVVLQLDTYHAEANYWAGVIHRARGNLTDALESFGWAARSLEFRAECYAQMAELYLVQDNLNAARKYANNALDFNRFHFGARYTLTLVADAAGDQREQARQISMLLSLDPINHLANYEKYKLTTDPKDLETFQRGHGSELSYQTYLELAIEYLNRGSASRARAVLALAPEHPLIDLWHAWLIREKDWEGSQALLQRAEAAHPDYVFPYRLESGEVLQWAISQSSSWKMTYYRALQLWSWSRKEEARKLMAKTGSQATSPTFYLSRSALHPPGDSALIKADLEKAYHLDSTNWRVLLALQGYMGSDRLKVARYAHKLYPDNDALTFSFVEALLGRNEFAEAIEVLTSAQILPFEGAGKGHQLWVTAHLQQFLDHLVAGEIETAEKSLGKARQWPENLGVGQPYEPNEIMIDLAQLAVDRARGSEVNSSAKDLIDQILCVADIDCSRNEDRHEAPNTSSVYFQHLQPGDDLTWKELGSILDSEGITLPGRTHSIIKHILR